MDCVNKSNDVTNRRSEATRQCVSGRLFVKKEGAGGLPVPLWRIKNVGHMWVAYRVSGCLPQVL